MFRFKNGMHPQPFDDMFLFNSQISNYNTRSSKLFRLPKVRINICTCSLSEYNLLIQFFTVRYLEIPGTSKFFSFFVFLYSVGLYYEIS